MWVDPEKEQYRTTRVLSNNSIHLWEKPSYEKLQEIFTTIKTNGEPGLSIAENAAKRRPNYAGSNPCHEILLDHQGVCNLTTLNLAAFVENGDWLFDNLMDSMRLITRMGSRITLVDMWDSEWDYVQKRDRLLGVSLTGIVEAYNSLSEYNQQHFNILLSGLHTVAREEADSYHEQLGIQRSLLVTTVKPEGTISQLPTVSSGVHAPYAPYYKRRIRVSSSDPIAKALRDIGLKPVPENGQGEDLYAPECNTWVFEFPVKTQAEIRAIDEPAIAQLERYKMLMSFYAEHTVSVTITVAENEWDEVCKWVYDNWDYCIGIAFLPRFDPSDSETPYPNMPYEATTEDQYYDLEINEDQLIELISFYETEYEEYDLDASCGGKSACPIR